MNYTNLDAGTIRMALAGAVVLMLCTPDAEAVATGDYAQDLAQVYQAHQRILAIKDACNTALPRQRDTNEEAYSAWKDRNRQVIADLERRFTEMIRGVSKDEKDIAKNVGKYEGAILKQRQEYTQAFLAQPQPEIERLCREFPDSLKSSDTDLEKAYAEELASVRKRK